VVLGCKVYYCGEIETIKHALWGCQNGSSSLAEIFLNFIARLISWGLVASANMFEVTHSFEMDFSLDFMLTFGLGKLEKHVNDICAFRE
jgi:hypothetical protein